VAVEVPFVLLARSRAGREGKNPSKSRLGWRLGSRTTTVNQIRSKTVCIRFSNPWRMCRVDSTSSGATVSPTSTSRIARKRLDTSGPGTLRDTSRSDI